MKSIQFVVAFLVILLVIEVSGITDLESESVYRRLFHMYQRTSLISNRNYIKPFCTPVPQILTIDEVSLVKRTIMRSPKPDVSSITRRGTATRMFSEFSTLEQNMVVDIRNKVRERLERKVGFRLYPKSTALIRTYEYFGNKSFHDWHVDPNNKDNWFVVIICIDRTGRISKFEHIDAHGKVHTIDTQEGDGALFAGGTTMHRVPRNDDPASFRRVLTFAFLKTPVDETHGVNICAWLKGGNDRGRVLLLIAGIYTMGYVSERGAKKYADGTITKTTSLSIALVTVLLSRFFPDVGIGTGRNISFDIHAVSLMVMIMATTSVTRGSLLYSYFIGTDTFAPRKYVHYY